jgi:hypothetical protein
MHGGAGVRIFIVNWTLASLGGYRIGILGAFTGGSTVISGIEQTAGSTGVGGAKEASGFAGLRNGIAFGHANCLFCCANGCGKEGSAEGASCAAPGMLRSSAAIGIRICIAATPRFYPTANTQQRPGVEGSKLVSHATFAFGPSILRRNAYNERDSDRHNDPITDDNPPGRHRWLVIYGFILGFDAVDAQWKDVRTPLPRRPPVGGRIGMTRYVELSSLRPALILANRQ